MKPTFSVIVSSYNRLNKLKRALSSIDKQNNTDYEVIIVDDFSTDGSREWLRKLQRPNYDVTLLDKNVGQAKATNIAVGRATGTWLAFLDADDYWTHNKLHKTQGYINLFSEFGMSEYYCFFSSKIIVDANGKLLRKVPAPDGECRRDDIVYRNVVGCQSSVIVARELYEKVGGLDENLSAAKDWDLWIRLSERYKFFGITDYLVFYEENDESISSNLEKVIKGREEFWQKHCDLYKENKIKRDQFIMFAKFLFNRGHVRTAHKYILSAIKVKPICISPYLLYFVMLMPRKAVSIIYNMLYVNRLVK